MPFFASKSNGQRNHLEGNQASLTRAATVRPTDASARPTCAASEPSGAVEQVGVCASRDGRVQNVDPQSGSEDFPQDAWLLHSGRSKRGTPGAHGVVARRAAEDGIGRHRIVLPADVAYPPGRQKFGRKDWDRVAIGASQVAKSTLHHASSAVRTYHKLGTGFNSQRMDLALTVTAKTHRN